MSIESFHAQLERPSEAPLLRALATLRTSEKTRTVLQSVGNSVLWPVWDPVKPVTAPNA